MRRPRRPHSCLAHHLASDKGCRTMADGWSTRGLSVSSAEMSRSAWVDWDLPAPYLALLDVARADIDAYDHVNNAVYMTWFDRAAWQHSAALGLPIEKCLQLDRGMAVPHSVIAYLRPAALGDSIRVATWLLPADGKLRVRRRFQVRRGPDRPPPPPPADAKAVPQLSQRGP